MSKLELNILGCGSAFPTLRHMPSCQVIDRGSSLLMIDCGEGAQLSMRRQGLSFAKLSHIFISHLHGDHCLGLTGLVATLNRLGRENGSLTIHTFADGAEMLRRMIGFFCGELSFELKFDILNPKAPAGEIIAETAGMNVSTFPLYHRLPCVGFRFDEQPKLRHIKGDMAAIYGVPHYKMASLRQGEDFVTSDGRVIGNSVLTTPAEPAWSYAYASDSMFDLRVAKAVEGVTTLYHESTYTHDLRDKAVARGHSTALQAAEIARLAGAKRLLIGHYSKRYTDDQVLEDEAKLVFPNTLAVTEGMKIDLEYR